jgi:D-inositol-3-phosphate glycosyltransferase
MRIAMVSEHASPLAVLGGADAGGQNVHVAELACALVRRGHEVVVYTRADAPHLRRQEAFTDGVVVEHVPAGPARSLPKDDLLPHMSSFGNYLLHRWSTRPPDVVHAHFWMSGLAATAAARPLGVPVVQTFHALGAVKRRHQGDADTSPQQRVAVERRLAKTVDRIIATCTDEAFELSRLGAPFRRVHVVPCGVDPLLFRPDGPRAPRGRGRRIVSVGRLVPRKGVDDVIRALGQLPDVELLVAGGPAPDELDTDSEVRRLRAVARVTGVASRVIFLGRVAQHEMPPLYRSADIVTCYPWYEPFGIVPLEAMACGVPVVAAAVGGMVDTVVDGGTGRLVPSRQPELLAGTLRALLDDPGAASAYGLAGRDRVQRRYTWARVAEQTERAYDGLFGDSDVPVAATTR